MSRFAALAIAHRSSNATGPLQIACEPLGLRLEFCGVRRHALGFAPALAAHHASALVPYSAVRALVREGPVLLLALDARAIAPYNRFALTRFRRQVDSSLLRASRLRAAVALASVIVPPSAAVLTALAVPNRLVAGLVGKAALGFVALLLTWRAVRLVLDWLSWGGPRSDRLRDEFEAQLGQRLGLEPANASLADPVLPRATLLGALAAVSRPRLLSLAVAVAIAGAALAVLALGRFGVAREVRLPVAEAQRGLTAPIGPLLARARAQVTPKHAACRCERADSALWHEGLPRLSIVVSPRKGEFDSLWLEPRVVHPLATSDSEIVELDVAAINNSDQPIQTVSVVITFWRRVVRGRRNVSERGLHWPDALGPGESVKWRIYARGSELRATSYVPGRIGEGYSLAPAESFARLERASLMSVRVHGVMMLAYLGDPRAEAAVSALGPQSPLEERARASISTLAPLVACDVRQDNACIMNRSAELVRSFVTKGDRGGEWRTDDLLFAGSGMRVTIPDAANAGAIAVTAVARP
jgi:hypothetical protein